MKPKHTICDQCKLPLIGEYVVLRHDGEDKEPIAVHKRCFEQAYELVKDN